MHWFTKFSKTVIRVFVCMFAITVAIGLSACDAPATTDPTDIPSTASTAPVSNQRLQITATIDYSAESVDFPLPNSKDGIHIRNLKDATLVLSGEACSLTEAISSNAVTLDELIAWARIDASNGFCKETFQSQNGLSHFTYRYAQIELLVYDDVYETPDGQQHRIRSLTIRDGGGSTDSVRLRYLGEDGVLYAIDREDWGLTWEAGWSQEKGLYVRCSQSDGQQIGQLGIYDYLASSETFGVVASVHTEMFLPITSDGTTEFILDLADGVDALPSGDYGIRISVKDIYDANQIHPLMLNFYDSQTYYLTFSVP